MSVPFTRAPHQGSPLQVAAPNAALLIDFDNVTMGIRSDLTKELKALLNSDIIKGKVAVQRAYADWRRYPQYIVPLSEASIDLIFAPAYGSSKKNATDIRLAIDALELVFTRPEIGTFILLSGDSDFSSMVLKLKEYGKYVIGVGIRESSSDLLVQNCDEYYSYSALTGLTKAGEESMEAEDPWVLVERAVRQMADQGDVMRSDRLKQVMLELDSAFDEKALGFSKYNRFLTEAASRGCLQLKKMENGQYEVAPPDGSGAAEPSRSRGGRGRGRGREGGRESRGGADSRSARAEAQKQPDAGKQPDAKKQAEGKKQAEAEKQPAAKKQAEAEKQPAARKQAETGGEPESGSPAEAGKRADRRSRASAPAAEGGLEEGYDLLRRAVAELRDERGGPVRDSDVKRRMLELREGWDESVYGFPKFSRFLRQAHDAEVIDLRKAEGGAYEVEPRGSGPAGDGRRERGRRGGRGDRRGAEKPREREARAATARGEPAERPAEEVEVGPAQAEETAAAALAQPAPEAPVEEEKGREEGGEAPEAAAAEAAPEPAAAAPEPAEESPARGAVATPATRRHVRGTLGARRGPAGGPPPVLPGQVVGVSSGNGGRRAAEEASEAGDPTPLDVRDMGLPTDRDSVMNYLQNSYKGVGQKTAEALVDALGAERVFTTLHEDPDRVREVLGAHRSDAVLNGWTADYDRRLSGGDAQVDDGPASSAGGSSSRGRRGRRGGRGRRKTSGDDRGAS